MQNHGKISRLIVLIILNIILLAYLIVISNFTYAQQLHDQTLYEVTKRTPTQIAHITAGKNPSGLGVNPDTNTIYVTNFVDNTVSVIDGTTNTMTGKPIPVGKNPEGSYKYNICYQSQ